MRQNITFLSLIFLVIQSYSNLSAQSAKILIVDEDSKQAISDVKILDVNSGQMYYSDQEGYLEFNSSQEPVELNLKLTHPLYSSKEIKIRTTDCIEAECLFSLKEIEKNIDLSTIQIEGSEDQNQTSSEVYSLLNSSDDPLLEASAYEWSTLRFRPRGISTRYDQLGFNGFILNDLTTDLVPYYLLSGQNNLSRYADNRLSYDEQEFDFGSVGINQWIRCNPSSYRKGLSAFYSLSNRSYFHRLGVNYSGRIKFINSNILMGANRRWAQEGAFPGTFYDAYGAYLGINHKFKSNASLNFTFFFAPVARGKSSPVVDEVVELTGDPLYNSYWGYQEGEKRNSRVASSSSPVFMLNYDWNESINTHWYTGIMYLSGSNYETNMDWYNIRDPRPDYYRYLPSFYEDSLSKQIATYNWQTNSNISQMDWNNFYQTNYYNYDTVITGPGLGSKVYGRRSLYILAENHNDPKDFEVYARRLTKLRNNSQLLITGRFENSTNHSYSVVSDLLGGDFYVDLESFVEGNQNPDSSNPNRIVHVGDKYGYDYTIHNSKISSTQQLSVIHRRIDFNLAFMEAYQWMSLNRKFSNALFDNSKELNNPLNKFNLGSKFSITYKINGRNYINSLISYQWLNPNSDQILINPAWRNDVLPYTNQTKIGTLQFSYNYRSPEIKFYLRAYYLRFDNQIQSRNFYLDADASSDPTSNLFDGGFVNGFYTDLDEVHKGIELSISYSIHPSIDLIFTGSKGEYYYKNRPTYYFYDQFSNSAGSSIIYLKNFNVPGTPQTALTAGIKLNLIKNGFATINFNYLDDAFVEINPLRRTPEAVEDIDRKSELFKKIIEQEKLPKALLLNASIFKSWTYKKKYLSASINVNNILNNKDLLSGGFEQSRYDFTNKNVNKFPNKYFHLQGINYFINFNISLN